jgi:hypothetical protein
MLHFMILSLRKLICYQDAKSKISLSSAPVGVNRVPNVDPAALRPDFATLVTTAQTTATAATANPDDAVTLPAALAASGDLRRLTRKYGIVLLARS